MSIEFINMFLKPNNIQKKKNGEVFTPLELIREKCSKVPEEFWRDKNVKVLDPCCGIGNYQVVLIEFFMKGLVEEIPDEKERLDWIKTKILYCTDICALNVALCKKITEVENIYCMDFLSCSFLDEMKFDMVIGNPPYNKGGIKSFTRKQLGDKNQTIWPLFVKKSFDILKNNCHLLFIIPLSWMNKTHSVHKLILEKKIKWIKLWDNANSKKNIGGEIPISIFYLINSVNSDRENTNIENNLLRKRLVSKSIEYLDYNYSIPLANWSIFNKLANFIKLNNLQLEYKKKIIIGYGERIKLPKIYNLVDMYAVDTYTIKEGILVKKCKNLHCDANKKKIIIANKCSFTGCFIDDGKLSISGHGAYYIIGDNLEYLLELFSFKIIKLICDYTKYAQDFLNQSSFSYIPDIRKLFKKFSEIELYKEIGLTDEEIKFIENI